MNIKIKMLAGAIGSLICASAYAVPDLQLNITGGIYDNVTETVIVTGGTTATVNAYMDVTGKNALTDTYALSVALSPQTGPDNVDLGSFVIAGISVDVTDDMVYGVPPLETVWTQDSDPGDLATHSIFDTFFKELSFSFDATSMTASVNTQDTPGYDPTSNVGSDLYYKQFAIDTSALAEDIALHFDLYNLKICADTKGQCQVVDDADQSNFAPFSHDAEWRPVGFEPPPPAPGIPEPAPLALVALGGILLGWMTRKKRT